MYHYLVQPIIALNQIGPVLYVYRKKSFRRSEDAVHGNTPERLQLCVVAATGYIESSTAVRCAVTRTEQPVFLQSRQRRYRKRAGGDKIADETEYAHKKNSPVTSAGSVRKRQSRKLSVSGAVQRRRSTSRKLIVSLSSHLDQQKCRNQQSDIALFHDL